MEGNPDHKWQQRNFALAGEGFEMMDELKSALEEQEGVKAYNELVLSSEVYASRLPFSIEAEDGHPSPRYRDGENIIRNNNNTSNGHHLPFQN